MLELDQPSDLDNIQILVCLEKRSGNALQMVLLRIEYLDLWNIDWSQSWQYRSHTENIMNLICVGSMAMNRNLFNGSSGNLKNMDICVIKRKRKIEGIKFW